MNQRWENLNMQKWRFRAAAFVLGLAAPLVGWAQNTIQAITSSQQAGTEVIRIELSEPLSAVPNGFTVQAPPRVAIDLPGIGNGLGRSTVDINQGNLRSVNVAQAGDRDISAALARYETIRRGRATRVQQMSRANGRRFHLPDGPDQQARDAAMASSFGISPEIDWLYGHDPTEPQPALT